MDELSKSGFYMVRAQKSLQPIHEWDGENSINGLIKSGGYLPGEAHVVFTKSDKIDFIIFEKGRRLPVWVHAKDDAVISFADVTAAIDSIDWNFEKRQLDWEIKDKKRKGKKQGCLVAIIVTVAVFILLAVIGELSGSQEEINTTDNAPIEQPS